MADTQKSGGTLLTASDLSEKQQEAVSRLYEYDATLCIAPTGEGKTAISLFTIQELINDGQINRCIVVAPAKVCGGWVREALKWDLNIHVATGTGLKGARKLVDSTANVLVISYESVPELVKLNHGCDGIVFDEITRLKQSGGVTFKALRYKMKHFTWRVGLSATPLSENWQAVYATSLILDDPPRFGRSKDRFLQEYFYQVDYKGYDFELRPGMDKKIAELMSDLVYIIPESYKRDKMPEPSYEEINIGELPDEIKEIQKQLIKHYVAPLSDEEDDEIVAANAAVVSSKLRQLAQGFVYQEGIDTLIWDGRIKIFAEVIKEKLRAGPVVATYEFTAALELIRPFFGAPDIINGKTKMGELDLIRSKWQAGKGTLLFLQVKAGSHGLDFLQHSAWQMVHFAPTWSRDGWLQLSGRLDRTGQKHPVEVTTLMANGTIDEVVRDRVVKKGQVFKDFLKHLI